MGKKKLLLNKGTSANKPAHSEPLKGPKIHQMRVRKGHGRFLAYNPAIKDEFVVHNKRVLLSTYKLIHENLASLREGRLIENKKNGVKIVKAATGSYKGGFNFTTLKVQTNGREFFVKIALWIEGEKLVSAAHAADKQLKKIGHKLDGFHLQVIKSHIIYDDPSTHRTFLVTEFYNPGEVVQAFDLKGEELNKVSASLEKLKKNMAKIGIRGIGIRNAFYHQESNTILLFDLLH